jgi:hypothetical protein
VVLGVVSALLMMGAGCAALRLLGIAQRPVMLGLAPVVGFALLAVLSTWGLQIGVPETMVGILLLVVCLAGLVLGVRAWVIQGELKRRVHWPAAAMLVCALLIPLVVLPQAISIQAGVPDYTHDGAHHAETVDALRHGSRIAGFAWYPTGFHAPAAALLSLVPAVDSASGVVDWAVGLTLLAPLAVFSFGAAVWRDLRVGAAGAILLALTSSYPYDPTLYSVWPMAAGLLLVVGLWTVASEYLARPTLRLAILAGLLASGLLLTHGTEIYTALIGLVVLAAPRWRVVASRRVVGHLGIAAACALVFAAPYLPQLGVWAGAGGTVAVGTDYYDARHGSAPIDPIQEVLFWAAALSSGYLVDLPFRLALLGVGAWMSFRARSGMVVVMLTVFLVGLVASFRYVDAPSLRALFALTLPWGVDNRLVMTVPLLAAPLGGAGLVGLAGALGGRARASRAAGGTSHVRWPRMGKRALVLGLSLGVASVFLVANRFAVRTNATVTYSAHDAAAMTWLRGHAQPGEVLMNDGAADAGIWAPDKANVSIVLPRTRGIAPDGPELLVRENVGELDSRADVRAAACELGVHYVFRGDSQNSAEDRQFPSVDALRSSSALEEIFNSGDAALFRTRLNCQA